MVWFKYVDFRKKSFSVVSFRLDFKDFFFNKYFGEKEMWYKGGKFMIILRVFRILRYYRNRRLRMLKEKEGLVIWILVVRLGMKMSLKFI